MTGELNRDSPSSSAKAEDDFTLDCYSFAIEYTGPPVSHYIPQVAPVDVDQIPMAVIAAEAVISSNLSLPIVQPIMKRSVDSIKREFFSQEDGELDAMIGDGDNVLDGDVSYSSSGTLESSDVYIDSHELLGSWDFGELADDACNNHSNPVTSDSMELTLRSPKLSPEVSCGNENGFVEDLPSSPRVGRVPVVTFRNLPSNDSSSEEANDDEIDISPRRLNLRKGECYRCKKRSRFAQKVVCIVCGAKYCRKCILRAMGSMPEGRKCITCIGYRVDESRRRSLGKRSRLLGRLLGCEAVKQIMSAEISCTLNQLPPHLIIVNDKPLSIEELVMLQSCPNPPKRLKPGKYWYDKVSGFWGKDGEKPSQIITADLGVGYSIRPDASNGNTGVLINSREITKAELWMLQAAGIHYEGSPHFWVTPDGSYQLEGMNYVMGKLWNKKRVRLVCVAMSLPFLSDTTNCCGERLGKDINKVNPMSVEKKMIRKLLLVGCHQSGTSTIYKQAKFLYDVPFSEDEKESIKFKIQRNLYRYIATLLEGHEMFAKEHETEMNKLADEPGPSGASDQVDEKSAISFSPRLKAFSTWLLQVMMSGNLEAIFPAATREYSPLVEELWKDKCFQATYKRIKELHTLPGVAHYFLEKAVDISQMDYVPSQMDIMYAGGIGSSNGVSSMEFYFPKSSDEEDMEIFDQNDTPTSYQLIRIHASILGENCKRLEMFEDVDLVIYCVSLTEYDEYHHEDINGVLINKMLATKKHFETIVTQATLIDKNFLLLLTKYDILEEKIEQCPLTQCDWFQDFSPVTSHRSNNPSTNNLPLAQQAFHYMAVKFKRLFYSLTGRTLFVSRVTGLEAVDVDKALKYGKEVLKWNDERHVISTNEFSTESVERSTTG